MNLRACTLLALVATLVTLVSCTPTSDVNSRREQADLSLALNAHYDSESKLRYMVTNDDTHVYVRFDTDNYGTIMRIRKYGVIVHFDKEGKRKVPYWIKYPIYDQPVQGAPVADEDIVAGGHLQRNLFPPSTTAHWHAQEELRSIDLGANAEGFVCAAGLDSMNVFVYKVGVPFAMLGAARPEDLPTLRILLEVPSAGPDEKASSSDNSSSGSVPGGSVLGNGTMNPNMPGSMGNMNNSAMATARPNSGPTPYRIWMDVKLTPSSK